MACLTLWQCDSLSDPSNAENNDILLTRLSASAGAYWTASLWCARTHSSWVSDTEVLLFTSGAYWLCSYLDAITLFVFNVVYTLWHCQVVFSPSARGVPLLYRSIMCLCAGIATLYLPTYIAVSIPMLMSVDADNIANTGMWSHTLGTYGFAFLLWCLEQEAPSQYYSFCTFGISLGTADLISMFVGWQFTSSLYSFSTSFSGCFDLSYRFAVKLGISKATFFKAFYAYFTLILLCLLWFFRGCEAGDCDSTWR